MHCFCTKFDHTVIVALTLFGTIRDKSNRRDISIRVQLIIIITVK